MQAVWAILAFGVALFHLAFALFVALGGFLVLRRRGWAWVHLPCVLWGAWVEFAGWVCPLTPLENLLRARAGLEAYGGDFVARWVFPLLYPAGLTRRMQIALGGFAVAINLLLYGIVLMRRRVDFAK